MKIKTLVILVVAVTTGFCTSVALSQQTVREPHIGYLYPAGGKKGTKVLVCVGGQFLRGAEDVYITGEGVRAKVIEHYRPIFNIEKEQRDALTRKMLALFEARWEALRKKGQVKKDIPWEQLAAMGGFMKELSLGKPKADTDSEEAELPKHPLLYNLDKKNIYELLDIVHTFRNLRKGQRNAQIGEQVLIEVTINANATPGPREIRLVSRNLGLTNPMVIQVGDLKEISNLEIEEARLLELLEEPPPLKLPVLVNGQIMPGDSDRFRFIAKKDQHLVIEVQARQLIPYLADAVPGWFQATITLYDHEGNEIAFADDYHFSPDPVLYYVVPEDGVYELEIRDSIYRGREDFVYRITISEHPFITSIFPLGCRPGEKKYADVFGWNLRPNRLPLDAIADPKEGIKERALKYEKTFSNPVAYEVSTLRTIAETEPNDRPDESQKVRLPLVIDGVISQAGDLDFFRFTGKEGDEIVAEIVARRLRSPLDSLLRLIDEQGHVICWNDDFEHKEGFLHTDMGEQTHHADSYLRATLPKDGDYYVQVADAQGQAGQAYAYRVRISPPRPDFELRATPASLNLRPGLSQAICVHALRKDDFDSEIEVNLKDAPAGFRLHGNTIPAGCDRICMTIAAPGRAPEKPISLKLEGQARIGEKTITHESIPAEDLMQAFLYRHLTPVQEMVAHVQGRPWRGAPVELIDPVPVRIPAGEQVELKYRFPIRPFTPTLTLELDNPPAGISLQDIAMMSDGIAFTIRTDGDVVSVGLQDNIIVNIFTEVVPKKEQGKENPKKERVFAGVLPAIPIIIVEPSPATNVTQ